MPNRVSYNFMRSTTALPSATLLRRLVDYVGQVTKELHGHFELPSTELLHPIRWYSPNGVECRPSHAKELAGNNGRISLVENENSVDKCNQVVMCITVTSTWLCQWAVMQGCHRLRGHSENSNKLRKSK
jgi:hypothetical protein